MQKKIGNLNIKNFTVLAPITGISNIAFRLLIKKIGCGLVFSEMISSNALIKKNPKSINLLRFTNKEKPIAIQLVGSDPEIIARAATKLEELNADIIDINCGCSVKKILKNGSGGALMKNINKLKKILITIKKTINIPLTIKIRSGWCPSGKDAVKIATLAEDCGVNAITIHPRTITQGFRGIADWNIIKKIKKKIKIPIIGNGDIKSSEDAFIMKKLTNCDYVMIGRSSIKKPLIFKRINIKKKLEKYKTITNKKNFFLLDKYLKIFDLCFRTKKKLHKIKKQTSFFFKRTRNSSYLLFCNNYIISEKELYFIYSKYKIFLKKII